MSNTNIIQITYTADGAPDLPLGATLVINGPATEAVEAFGDYDGVARVISAEVATINPGETYNVTARKFINLNLNPST